MDQNILHYAKKWIERQIGLHTSYGSKTTGAMQVRHQQLLEHYTKELEAVEKYQSTPAMIVYGAVEAGLITPAPGPYDFYVSAGPDTSKEEAAAQLYNLHAAITLHAMANDASASLVATGTEGDYIVMEITDPLAADLEKRIKAADTDNVAELLGIYSRFHSTTID